MKNKMLAMPLILFSALVIFFISGLHKDPHELPSVLIGKPIKNILPEKPFKKHITLLNVWASWCTSCRLEHNVLLQIAADKTMKQQLALQIFGLNYKDDSVDAKAMLAELGNPYDKIFNDPNGKIGMNLGVYGTPETFIINQAGVISYRYVGPISPQVWHNKLLPIIKKMRAPIS